MIRKVLVQGFKIVFSGLLVGFLLRRIGVQRIVDQFHSADICWLMGALVLLTMSHFLGSFQWWILLRSNDIRISWRKTISVYFIGLFFNNFFIGALGGDFFRMVDVRRYSKNGTGAVSTVFLDRFVGLLVLSGMAVAAAMWVLIRGDMWSYLQYPLVVLFVGWIFVLFFLFNKRFARPFAWLIQKVIPEGMSAKTREVYQKIHDFGRQRNLIFRLICISMIIQSARVFTHYLLGRSLGITVSPVTFFLIIPFVAIMASLPLSLGGIGLREQTGVLLFGMVGMSALQGFSVEFLSYLVAIVTSLPGGILFIGRRKIEYGRVYVFGKTVGEGEEQ